MAAQYITQQQLDDTINCLRIEFWDARMELVDANQRLQNQINAVQDAVIALRDMQVTFLTTSCASAANSTTYLRK